jgi:hypothetical protein
MKSFHKSKYLKNKEHLWNLVENFKLQLEDQMKEIYGTPQVGKQALKLINDKLSSQDLPEADKQAIVGFLLNSFMAKNGTKAKGKRQNIWEIIKRFDDHFASVETQLQRLERWLTDGEDPWK